MDAETVDWFIVVLSASQVAWADIQRVFELLVLIGTVLAKAPTPHVPVRGDFDVTNQVVHHSDSGQLVCFLWMGPVVVDNH